MRYKNLVFLGTSHIAVQSLKEVRTYIENEKPDIIALELDKKRLNALTSKAPGKMRLGNIRVIGLKGFLFSLLGAWAEKKLGKIVGVAPGSEMKEALKLAKERNISIALVDQDIEVTLKRLSKSITWREKLNFLYDMTRAFFLRKTEIDFDLETVPDKRVIKRLTSKLKERYPSLFRVLIDERNAVIAENLKKLGKEKKILVILGAGHVEEVMGIVKQGDNPQIHSGQS